MNTAEAVLVIIVSSLLSIFLLLSIALAVAALKVLKSVRRVVDKAEDIVDSVETATDVIRNASGPLAALRIIRNIVNLVQRKK